MRLPKPKSIPGIFLWALTLAALAIASYVLTSLAAQNVENLSTERGYDKLLSRSWPFIVAWVRDNMLLLATSTAFLVGGATCTWIYEVLNARFGNTPIKWNWFKRLLPPPPSPTAEPTAAAPPIYPPVNRPSAPPKFNFAYPKAVLSCDFPPPSGSADSDGMTEMSAYIAVSNLFRGPLNDCSVHVVSVSANGVSDFVDEQLRWSKASNGEASGYFDLGLNQVVRRRFLFRDLKDRISNPPFVLHLLTRDYIMPDHSQYILALELRSEYERPTKVGVQIDIQTGKDIRITKIAETL